jgi:hypothetical protein
VGHETKSAAADGANARGRSAPAERCPHQNAGTRERGCERAWPVQRRVECRVAGEAAVEANLAGDLCREADVRGALDESARLQDQLSADQDETPYVGARLEDQVSSSDDDAVECGGEAEQVGRGVDDAIAGGSSGRDPDPGHVADE